MAMKFLGTLLTYNQACSSSNQCNSLLGLNCTNQICQCDNYHSWSSSNNMCKYLNLRLKSMNLYSN
jgi:hypothetical protein